MERARNHSNERQMMHAKITMTSLPGFLFCFVVFVAKDDETCFSFEGAQKGDTKKIFYPFNFMLSFFYFQYISGSDDSLFMQMLR